MPVTLRSLTGLLIFYRTRRFEASLCRTCGINMFRELQAITLVRGWWGLIAFMRNLFVVGANWRQVRAVRRMEMPSRRKSDLLTVFDGPPALVRSLARRPMPYLASGAAALVLAAAVAGGASSETGDTQPTPRTTTPFDAVGICFDASAEEVGCSSPDVRGQVDSYIPSDEAQSCFTGQRYVAIAEDRGGGGFCLVFR